jgi:hypothetical protein
MVSDNGAFFGEAFDMFGFFFEVAKRNKKREIGIFMAGVFNALIELTLDIFPDSISPGFDGHATADRRIFRHVGSFDYLLEPFGIVFLT